MQERYLAAVLIAFFVAMFGGLAIENYQKSQCRQEAIKANKSADEINKICT